MDQRSQYAEVPSAGEVTVSLDNGAVPTDVNTLPHVDHMTNAPVPAAEQPTLEGDFYHKPMEHLERIGLAFKIHAAVGLGVTVLCFFIWHWTTYGNAVWWWIFPAGFFGTTCVLHWHFSQGHIFEGVATSAILINVMMYLTFVTLQHDFPWWIYPCLVSAMVLVPLWGKTRESLNLSDRYNLIWLEYWLLNLTLFLTWANVLPLGHPWFFYPMILLAIPLVVYRIRTHYKETRIPVLVGIPLVMINLCFFIGWGFSDSPGPWFLIPLVICVAIEAFLIWRFRAHTTHEFIPDQPATAAPVSADPWAAQGYQQTPTAQPAPYNTPSGYSNPFGSPQ